MPSAFSLHLVTESALLCLFWLTTVIFLTGIGTAAVRFQSGNSGLLKTPFNHFWYGLGIIIIILQLWNLFLPVNGLAWLCLSPISLYGIYHFIKNKAYYWFSISGMGILALCVIAVFTIVSSLDNSFIYDSLVYHFYSIKWFNNYAVTKGMANLFIYLGLNQSYFLFGAFLNALWGGYKGACAANGLLILIICAEIIAAASKHFKQNKRPNFHVAFQLIFLPLCINAGVQNLSSPTPDVFINLLTFKILSDLIYCIQNKPIATGDTLLFIFLCTLGVVMKLSFIGVALGVMVMLLINVNFKTLRVNKYTLFSCLLLMLLFLPWLWRGVITSGYIGFPASAVSFPVDWKVPKAQVVGFAAYIKGFARTHLHGAQSVQSIDHFQWLVPWLKRMAAILGVILPLSLFLVTLLALKIKKIACKPMLICILPVLTALLFWFFTAPDVRFAVFLFWSIGIIPAAYLSGFMKLAKWLPVFITFCAGFIIIHNWNNDLEPLGNLPLQQYNVFTTRSGLKITTIKDTPPNDDWTLGDCKIPCAVYPDSSLVLRGANVNDGFKIKGASTDHTFCKH